MARWWYLSMPDGPMVRSSRPSAEPRPAEEHGASKGGERAGDRIWCGSAYAWDFAAIAYGPASQCSPDGGATGGFRFVTSARIQPYPARS